MRACILSSAPLVSGAEFSVASLAQHLQRANVHVEVLAAATVVADLFKSVGVDVEHLPELDPHDAIGWGSPRSMGYGRYIRWQWRLRAVVRTAADRANVLHVNSLNIVFAVLLAGVANRTVIDLHDVVSSRATRLWINLALRRGARVLAVSDYVVRGSGVGSADVHFRPLRSDNDSEVAASIVHTGRMRAAVVGRIDGEKRIEVAIDAMHLRPRWDLIVVGASHPASEEYLASLRARCPEGRVRFTGWVDAPFQALHPLDALVVCNPDEPMGRSVIEAMSNSVAVVVPRSGGASELVEDGHTGLTYEPLDAVQLADTIARLENRELRARLTDAALTWVGVHCSPKTYAREVASIYAAMASAD